LKKESREDLQLFILRGSMFKKQYESHESVSIIFEGKRLNVEKGLTVAAALLVSGGGGFQIISCQWTAKGALLHDGSMLRMPD